MKIREIITEDVDMGWWQDRDADYNPEALKQIRKQERRYDILSKTGNGNTPIFTKPVRVTDKNFSNIPPKDNPPSPGYVGNVEVHTRTKHISPEKALELTDINLPRSPRLPL